MRVAVMYSGGGDSTLLLHRALEKHGRDNVTAIYVNFIDDKTSPKGDDNTKFIFETLNNFDVDFIVENVTPKPNLGKGPEGNARDAFRDIREWAELHFDEVHLGHNADDHLETVMIQLFRGAGAGTKGIPDMIRGKVHRPLINMTRSQVRLECVRLGLCYFDDPANEDTSMTRVFWRNEMFPKLREHYGVGLSKRINNIATKFAGM